MHLVFTWFIFGSYWGHIGVILGFVCDLRKRWKKGKRKSELGSPWVHIWVTFGARIARQACATNWASKEEMKINEFPDCRRFPKLFQRSAFRKDDPESFDLETVISPIWMSSWARTWRTTLRGQCPLERACIRAVGACLRAARDHLRETLPGLFQQL